MIQAGSERVLPVFLKIAANRSEHRLMKWMKGSCGSTPLRLMTRLALCCPEDN